MIATARTMLDTVPPRLVVTGPDGELIWEHEADAGATNLNPNDADALLNAAQWFRSHDWSAEYDFDASGDLTLVGYTTTVHREQEGPETWTSNTMPLLKHPTPHGLLRK